MASLQAQATNGPQVALESLDGVAEELGGAGGPCLVVGLEALVGHVHLGQAEVRGL